MKGFDNISWNSILSAGWIKYILGGVIGLILSTLSSFAPDALWVHDNRQALSMVLAGQPLIQRDISDLKTGLGEVNLTMKELIVEMQKRRAVEELRAGRLGKK